MPKENIQLPGLNDSKAIYELYKQYIADSEQIDISWRWFFKGFEIALKQNEETETNIATSDEFNIIRLIQAYRQRGHLFTQTNPVRARRTYLPTLDLVNFGLENISENRIFNAGNEIGIGPATLNQIVEHLKQTYCRTVGAEFMYIRQPEMVEWLQNKMESVRNTPDFAADEKKMILQHLFKATLFEQFIQKKFTGQKRFSLEGAETLIPAMNWLIDYGSLNGISEIIIGMAHRGRLNVLANVLQKPIEKIFSEFQATSYNDNTIQGDVKYHLGYNTNIVTAKKQHISLALVPNPSHLETTGAIVQGVARNRIEHQHKNSFKSLLPVVIHGDAAIAGQGLVYETIQMAQLDGYKTGGTIHFIINNQVGFTTNYTEARSSTYCTDVAKVTRCPVFHVNGDDVESLVMITKLAIEYRQKYHSDVFIDLLCYRRYGHNEGDEPRFTQPLLYDAIVNHPGPAQIYKSKLINESVISTPEAELIQNHFENFLTERFEIAKTMKQLNMNRFFESEWVNMRHFKQGDEYNKGITGFELTRLINLALQINSLPENKKFFGKIQKIFANRLRMIAEGKADWALAEQLAFATLVSEGYTVRLSGQDSKRGTFSHRHAILVTEDTGLEYNPFQKLADAQDKFQIYNSPLSEYGVLGFEYGYSIPNPDVLTIWEAQFGDFHNVAQPVIDQYITSAEEKWGVMSAITLLLPHGFEGQGAEHSSARIERFLAACARNNIQIVNCTTPANFFHVIRRQLKRPFRLPLVVFTPKSLLRHPLCISELNELATGNFNEIIDDNDVIPEMVSRVVFCSGKIYYDLLQRKNELHAIDIALVRIEQLYPLAVDQIENIIKKYHAAIKWLWVQEEPENMGAWPFIHYHFPKIRLHAVCRQPSASPATGLHFIHSIEQNEIINKVFKPCTCELKNKYCGLQCKTGIMREEIRKQHTYIFHNQNETI